jgi:hypothetical protein
MEFLKHESNISIQISQNGNRLFILTSTRTIKEARQYRNHTPVDTIEYKVCNIFYSWQVLLALLLKKSTIGSNPIGKKCGQIDDSLCRMIKENDLGLVHYFW